MQNNLTNEFVYDENAIKEVISFWCKKEFKSLYIISAIFTISGILLFILLKNQLGLLLALLGVVSIGSSFININKNIKMEKERALLSNNQKFPTFNITIDVSSDEKIIMKSNKTIKEIPFNAISGVYQSDNFIIIFLNAKLTIPLKKDSFKEGSYEQCLEILKNYIKK